MYGGAKYRLVDGFARWNEEQVAEELTVECCRTAWQVQKLGPGERRISLEILLEGALLEELQLRLKIRTRRVGECG